MKYRAYSHPDWDSRLYVDDGLNGHAIALDIIANGDNPASVALLTVEHVEMTPEEFEKLPEWEG